MNKLLTRLQTARKLLTEATNALYEATNIYGNSGGRDATLRLLGDLHYAADKLGKDIAAGTLDHLEALLTYDEKPEPDLEQAVREDE